MAPTIGDETIISDRTAHTARTVADEEPRWEVSWLPGRHLDRNSAITATMLADLTGHGDVRAGHRLWAHAEGWAAELGLDAPDILTEIARQASREDADRNADGGPRGDRMSTAHPPRTPVRAESGPPPMSRP